jgi:hypothetical protein
MTNAAPDIPTLRTKLHVYRFDTRQKPDAAEWAALHAKLVAMFPRGEKHRMKSHGGPLHLTVGRTLGAHLGHSVDVELRADWLAANQWQAIGPDGKEYRVFDWAQDANPGGYAGGTDRRQGHWLEQTPEMIAIRRDTLTCGYCGHKAHVEDVLSAFCGQCLDGEYLDEANLPLLRMLPVADSFHATRPPLTEAEAADLVPRYRHAQTYGCTERGQKSAIARLEAVQEYAKEVNLATMKHNGMLWLLERGIRTDNFIFYNRTATFSLGWRRPLTPAEATAWTAKLEGFPAPLTIKKVGDK